MDWTAFSAIVNSVLADVTVGVLLVNRQQVKASKQQADASEDQVRLMQKQLEQSQEQMKEQVRISEQQLRESQRQVQGTLEAAQRPFLFPYNAPALKSDGGEVSFNFGQLDTHPDDPNADKIEVGNGGTGTALNILGILMPPRPQDDEEQAQLAPRARMLALNVLAPGNKQKSSHVARNFLQGWDAAVGPDPKHTYAAPPRADAISPVLRLTLAYYDIFGQRYISQFDLLPNSRWSFQWFGKVDSDSDLYERLKI